MVFVQDTEKTKIVTPTAMAVSPDKKYLAVCETVEDDIALINFQSLTSGVPLTSPQPPTPQVFIYFFLYTFSAPLDFSL